MGKDESGEVVVCLCWQGDWLHLIFRHAEFEMSYLTAGMKLKKCMLLERKLMTKLDRIKKERHHFADKGQYSQTYDFSSSHIWMWQVDHKEA